MKLLPYAKRLVERLRIDDRPWLVVMSVGGDGIPALSRRAWFKDGESAYIRVPDGVAIERADWGIFVALDVLVVPEDACTTERLDAVLHELWRARVAALWFLRTDGFVDGKPRVMRLQQQTRNPKLREFECWDAGTLPESFRAKVDATRWFALLHKEPPLYDHDQFSPARAKRCAELGLDPALFA